MPEPVTRKRGIRVLKITAATFGHSYLMERNLCANEMSLMRPFCLFKQERKKNRTQFWYFFVIPFILASSIFLIASCGFNLYEVTQHIQRTANKHTTHRKCSDGKGEREKKRMPNVSENNNAPAPATLPKKKKPPVRRKAKKTETK